MPYASLEECLLDLEKHGHLIRVREEVDPYLEMAAIHERVFALSGPALLFENVKGSPFRAASNIFGTLERSKFIFRDTLATVQQLIELRNRPVEALKQPWKHLAAGWSALNALPMRSLGRPPVMEQEIRISNLPLIHHWPMDGGAFVTLPQVYSEDLDSPGIGQSNLGMYRIQLTGNDYVTNEEIGLHYQLHRGIGVHQTKANAAGQPLKVSCFVGGPPSHTVAAVMPLPEGMSELSFAGILGGRRFRYRYEDGFCISGDADFVITGEVYPGDVKPEGPFGDHLGYYSLQHAFPVMRVHKVYARKNAIWPFTVVGRPPQEDTSFGHLIHEITGDAVSTEIPGLKEVHAVDAAGVHPLLLAIGSERYTPYAPTARPAELLTIANHILGTGQLSLAKFLFITAGTPAHIHTRNVSQFFQFMLERIDWERDLHFYTQTTIDTLDYSGTDLNSGSKLVIAAYGEEKRKLSTEVPEWLQRCPALQQASLIMPGIVAFQTTRYEGEAAAQRWIDQATDVWKQQENPDDGIPLLIWCDQAAFTAATLRNFLWVSFTRCNPSHDIHGIDAFIRHKHYGCRGPLVIDARIKPHHAPAVEMDPVIEKRVERLFEKGGSLNQLLS
ncbi:MAG: UbiD family decarboxylase [Bacteroidota bacterium]